METLRQLISDVRSMNRILSTDSMITDRAIASEIRSNSLLLIKRDTNLRKLWATDTIFTTIPCLELEEVSIIECTDFTDEQTIAKSRHKIPSISEGNYNYVIQGVYSINALGGRGNKLKEITINRYMNLLRLGLKRTDIYFWVNDDYIYVTDPDVQKIRVTAFFDKDIPNEIMYPEDCDCANSTVTNNEYCKNPLDKSFALPGYLRKQVITLTNQTLRETYFQMKADINSDGIDGQQSNASPTS